MEKHGLQIFDENGNTILDITDHLTRVLGEFETGAVNGSITDVAIQEGTFWYIQISLNYNTTPGNFSVEAPFILDVDGAKISWVYENGDYRINKYILYGVY